MIFYRSSSTKTIYCSVVSRYPDKNIAIEKLSSMNLDAKLLIDSIKNSAATESEKRVSELLSNFDFYIEETDPIWSFGKKAYTMDMKHISICLRKKDGNFYDDGLLMFVFLHELAHVCTDEKYTVEDPHSDYFWMVMKYLITKATTAGLIEPKDYKTNPVVYCGILVSTNPYFDI